MYNLPESGVTNLSSQAAVQAFQMQKFGNMKPGTKNVPWAANGKSEEASAVLPLVQHGRQALLPGLNPGLHLSGWKTLAKLCKNSFMHFGNGLLVGRGVCKVRLDQGL